MSDVKFFIVYGDDTLIGENIESVLDSFFAPREKEEILKNQDWEERSPDDYITLRDEDGSILFEGRLIDAYNFMKDKLPPPPCYFCSYLS